MKKEDLKQCNVVFDEESHTYWLNGKQLKGITGMIAQKLFPDKYKGVSKEILQNRADFGHAFHKEMENYINNGVESDSVMFKTFKENYSDIKFIASEYLVTDETDFASSIDAVDENGVIYDFKTSTKKDVEYWKWQLTIYRYLFTLQNGFEPKGYKVLWINKDLKHELVDIVPYDMQEAIKLCACEVVGVDYKPETNLNIVPADKLSALEIIENEITAAETKLKSMKENYEQMKKGILEIFQANGIKSWETDKLKFTVKDEYKKQSVDSKALKEKHPEVYNKVLKETTVNATLIIKLKEVS